MKKLLKAIITLCSICAFAVTACGETMSESGDWVYWVKDDGTAAVTAPAGAAVNNNNVVIPSELNGYKVTEIGNYCFLSQSGIFTVEIPSSVTVVGNKAFSDCYSLSTVSFGLDYNAEGEGTQVINDGAFMNCYALRTVYLPTTLKTIETDAFFNCKSLSSVNIPYGTEVIGEYAFAECTMLTSVILPSTINELGNGVFDDCSDSMEIYYEGTSAEWSSIKKDENDYKNIKIVFLSDGLAPVTVEPDDIAPKNGRHGDFNYKILEDGTAELTGYHGVEQDVVIPSEVDGYTVSKVGFSCFSYSKSLRSVEIPSSVKVIGDCFSYCGNLERVTFHEGLEIIEKNTFKLCEKLENITLPSTVTKIGDNAFQDCTAFTEIVIPDSVVAIGERAFSGCETLEKISFGKGITEIGEYCFQNCEKISRIEIPDGIITIEKGMFNKCEGLREIVIPVSVTEIKDDAFYGCYDLENVFYWGTEQEWNRIYIGTYNGKIKNCIKLFGYNPETYKPIGPVFAIILCGILIVAAVAVVVILMCRKGKTCPDCGRKLEEDSEFCGWCGKEL